MSRLILLPEDGEPHNVDGLKAPTEVGNLLRRFNPRLVGFGIVAPGQDSFYRATGLTGNHHQEMISDDDPEENK